MSWDRYAISVVFLAGAVWVLPATGVAVGYLLGRRHRHNNAKKVQR